MSRAFVEGQDDEAFAPIPDRPLSPHPNFVTVEGLAQIELALARDQAAWTAAEIAGDRAAMARIRRELRYWIARRATAQVVAANADPGRAAFGATVDIRLGDGRRQTWRIVGEDEADPAQGSLSYVSPLAQALVGRQPGERVQVGAAEIDIVSVT